MVAIKNFEMPKSCSQCTFCNESGWCILQCLNVEYVGEYTDDNRDIDCPLVEVENEK